MAKMILAALLFVFFPAGAARAAAVSWVGGPVGDWGQSANWSGSAVPGPADDVTIASSLVIAYSTDALISVQSLSLGGSGAILKTSTGVVVAGTIDLQSWSALQVSTPTTISAGSLVLQSGSSLTYNGTPATVAPAPLMTLSAGLFDLRAGSTLTAKGSGYSGALASAPGFGPGAGGAGSGTNGAGGGGHGGAGAFGGGASNGGVVSDVMPPADAGAGGGAGPASAGGDGGGFLRVIASTVVLDGLVDADGRPGVSVGFVGGGGGAGGAILVVADVLRGAGTLSARGGDGGSGVTYGGGGGGGGRIWLRESSGYDVFHATLTVRVDGGSYGTGSSFGGIGSAGAAFVDPRHWTGLGSDSLASTPGNWSESLAPSGGEHLVFGASATAKGCQWDTPSVAIGSATLTTSFSTTVVLASSMSVTGFFDMKGGTVAAGAGTALSVGGFFEQTGGRVNLAVSTLSLVGGGGTAAADFWDARAARLTVGGVLPATATVTGQLEIISKAYLAPAALLILSTGTVRFDGDGPFSGPGSVDGTPGSVAMAAGSSSQTWTSWPGRIGGLRVSNFASGGLTLDAAAGSTFTFMGGVVVDTGTLLRASTTLLQIGGDWSNYGGASLGLSTAAFRAVSGTSTLRAGASFDNLVIDASAGTVSFSTNVLVASSVTIVSGTLNLAASTVTVRGAWTEKTGSSVLGGTSVAIFDGAAAQKVHQLASGSFGAFYSSAAGGVTISSTVSTQSAFVWQYGALTYTGASLVIRGDLLKSSLATLTVTGSTMVLAGVSTQTVTFTSFANLVVNNQSAAGVRLIANASCASFRVAPAAVFDGGTSALTVAGPVWDTAFSTYLAVNSSHTVTWSPTTSILVASGSVVSAKLSLAANKTAVLQGDLIIAGSGNSFDPKQGSTVNNAVGGSSIIFRDSSDLLPSSPANWFYTGGVKNSWLVFEGTGTSRGSALSTTTFGGLSVRLAGTSEVFRAPALNLSGPLVVESGTFRPISGSSITVAGGVVQTGGVVDFSVSTSAYLTLTGTAPQALSLLSGSTLWHLVSAGTGPVTASDLVLLGNFTVSTGTFSEAAASLSLAGGLTVSAGAYFDGQTSTVTLNGAAAGRGHEFLAVYGGASFNGLVVAVSSATFLTSATAAVLTDAVAGSTLAFAPGSVLSVSDLRLGSDAGALMRVRSTTSGSPWFLRVTAVSSVTAAMVSDSDASPGATIPADDARSFDAGGNVNWDFNPNLLVLLPGETLTPGVSPGKSGAPSVSTAGVSVPVSVVAVSSRFNPAFKASGYVTLASDDPYAVIGASQPLVGGATTLSFAPRTAEPGPRATTLTASASFGSSAAVMSVIPAGLTRLQVILPGQAALPGSSTGRSGTPYGRVKNAAFTVTVRAVDAYWNAVATVTDTVALSATISSATLPAAAPLAAGEKTFGGLTFQVTGYFTISAADQTQPSVASDTSAIFSVSPPSLSSPTASFHVPTGAAIATLGGAVSGTAADTAAVERVLVDVREVETNLHYDWLAGSFSSVVAIYSTTTLAAPLTTATSWFHLLLDSALSDGRHYSATAYIDDPSGFTGTTSSTFTVDRTALYFGSKDGQGSASMESGPRAGCEAVVASMTFTVGSAGLSPGGALAVRVPDGWSIPLGTSTQMPPPAGYWNLTSTSLAATSGSTATLVNPAAYGSQTLGAGWLVVSVKPGASNSFLPGQKISLAYSGMPPLTPSGSGSQTFAVWTQGDSSGALAPISTQPALSLTAGSTSYLSFTETSPLALGTLQMSPTIQLRVSDLCGNDKPGASSGTASLSLVVPANGGYVPDVTAGFYSSTGGAITSVFLSTGFAVSPSFFLKVSTVGPSLAYLRAAAAFSGSLPSVPVEALREVRLAGSTVALVFVSVDTGTLTPGATSAVLSGSDPSAYGARFVFELSDPTLAWDLVLSTDAANFASPVLRASGFGDALRANVVSWDGVDRVSVPARSAPPGRYKARLRVAGGAAEDRSLEVVIPARASYLGRLGTRGSGASVRAAGPGAGEGAFAVASSTGYFQLFGVRSGQSYRLSVSTAVGSAARPLVLSTEVSAAPAAAPFVDLGSLALPSTASFRVAVMIPTASPRDALGGFLARAADGSAVFSGPLRFSSGAATSDDGGPLFGRAASTWSVVLAPPGVYDVEIELPDLRLSTRVASVSLSASGFDLSVILEKRANVFGWVIIPSTAPFGTSASLQARKAGDASPSVFAGVFISSLPVAVGPSSAAYSLYGLEPGTWTILASAPGFVPVSTTVAILDASDATGLDLALGMGGVVAGTVTVSGDSRGLTQCFAGPGGAPGACPAGTFELDVELLAAGRLDRASTRVRLPVSAVSSTAAFLISGLDPGVWTLRSSLPGFASQPAGGTTVSVASTGVSTAALTLAAQDARLRVEVLLPALAGGACRTFAAFKALGLSLSASDGLERVFGDVTAMTSSGAFVATHCSSVTLFSPPLPPGPVRSAALFSTTGNWGLGRALLIDATTASLTLDLSASTVSITGLLSLSGSLSLSTRTSSGVPFSIAASSPAGILSAAAGLSFCLLGSGDPLLRSALRVELVPYDPRDGAPALRRSTGGSSSCAAPAASSAPATSLAFVSGVSPDGAFSFYPGVAPGFYLLRVPGDLDDDPSNGDEAVEDRAFISVGTSAVVLSARLSRGSRVAGLMGAPAAFPSGRLVRILLVDAEGRTVRSMDVSPSPGGLAAFSFDGVADGRYSLAAEDLGVPRAFAAPPRTVSVAGADLSGLALSLSASGTIRARFSAARLLPDGSEVHELIGWENASLLPRGFSVRAVAVPAAAGGPYVLRAGVGGAILDGQGRVSLDGLLPGVYDVEFIVPSDTSALAAGGLALSPSRVSGVAVAAGQAVDLGVVPLFASSFVSGRVLDAVTGAGIAGLRVTARPSRGAGARPEISGELSVATDVSGRYLLRGLDSSARWYDVTAAPRGEMSHGDPVPLYEARRVLSVDVSSGAVQDFLLSPAASTIRGRVVASDGAALSSSLGPGAVLSLQKAGLAPAEDPLSDLSFRTDADGLFVIPAVATGAYRLTASALGLAGTARAVIVNSSEIDLGTLSLGSGGSVSGEIRLPDGSSPSEEEVSALAAVAPDSSEFFYAALTRDARARTVTGYRLGGLSPGRTYRLIIAGAGDSAWTPPEGAAVAVASSAEAKVIDLVLRPAAGPVSFRARRAGTSWRVEAVFPRPLRARFLNDDDASLALSTVSAAAALSSAVLSSDRRSILASYDPAPGETSLVLRARAALAAADWDSSDPLARELIVDATATISLSADGLHRAAVANAVGGTLSIEADPARVVLPRGALSVDASTSVMIDFIRSAAPLGAGELPAGVVPAGEFYDISLPAGVPTRLARPAELTLSYSSAVVDAGRLSVYWYNPASRVYVLQPDVTGSAAAVDRSARTVTIHVDHFSTYVLLDSSIGSIGGSSFAGGDLEAYNFPNPFDLSVKTVVTIHGGGSPSIRGTMIKISVPPGVSGEGTFRVFDVTGRLIRAMSLGSMSGGMTSYQAWDGRNDAGGDAASGLYIGQVEISGRRKSFKMAVLK